MDKNETEEELKKRGYDVSASESIVIIKYVPGTYEETKKEISTLLLSIKYDASWGLVPAKKQINTTDESVKGEKIEDEIDKC